MNLRSSTDKTKSLVGTPIVTASEMSAIDAAAPEAEEELIARAGWAIAREARSMLDGVYGHRVAVIVGPGNNGHDAKVAESHLRRWGVATVLSGPFDPVVESCDLVIDGAFGTGMNREYMAPRLPPGVPVLSIDIPSGLDSTTGEPLGRPVVATSTVTFAALKPGLLLPASRPFVGKVKVVDIGLDTDGASSRLMTEAAASQLLPRHSMNAHKWKRATWVIGGSPGMFGAPLLAAQAGLRSGSGMVRCSLPGEPPPTLLSEVVFHPLEWTSWHRGVIDEAARFGALVIGCGLDPSAEAAASIRSLVEQVEAPIVIDAGGLRSLGERPALRSNVVLTPHDGEFTALMGNRPGPDRFAAVRELAAVTGATVLLKGPLTLVADPAGRCFASNSGDARLATAGTGDVLAGLIGSYLAAGLEPVEAGALAAWVHGAAGQTQRPYGMVASDLIAGLADVQSNLVSSPNSEHPDTPNEHDE